MTKTKTFRTVIIILLFLTTPALALNLNSFNTQRFTQPDTVIPDLYNPQSLNRYSYVLNNPYKYVDPDGHNPLLLFSAIGGVLGAAYDMVSQIWHGASMFDSSMNWGSVGTSALIGAGAGLVGGVVSTAVGVGVLGQTIVGASSMTTYQAITNVVYGNPLYQNVGLAGVMGTATGSVFGGVGRVVSSFRSPKINLNYGGVQEFSMSKIHGTHSLDKSNIMSPQKMIDGFSKGPAEIYNYEGRLIINDGMGRSGRYALTTGKNTIPGRIMNPSPEDVTGWEIARDLWYNNGKPKYNLLGLVNKMRKE